MSQYQPRTLESGLGDNDGDVIDKYDEAEEDEKISVDLSRYQPHTPESGLGDNDGDVIDKYDEAEEDEKIRLGSKSTAHPSHLSHLSQTLGPESG